MGNRIDASEAQQFSELISREPVTIETFKQAVQDRACRLLDENSRLVEAAQQRYQDRRSPAYTSLKKAVEKEKDLQQREEECFAEYMNRLEMYEKAKHTAVCSLKCKEGVQVLKTRYEEARQQYENIKSANLVLHSGFPELSALDINDIEANTSNEEIYQNLTEGVRRIQKDIMEAKEKIRNNDVPLDTLSNVLTEVKRNPEFSGIQDEINACEKSLNDMGGSDVSTANATGKTVNELDTATSPVDEASRRVGEPIASKSLVGNVDDFIESQSSRISAKLGAKIRKGQLSFPKGRTGFDQAVDTVRNTLSHPSKTTHIIPKSSVRGDYDLIHIYSSITNHTVSLRVLEKGSYEFDTLIQGLSSKF